MLIRSVLHQSPPPGSNHFPCVTGFFQWFLAYRTGGQVKPQSNLIALIGFNKIDRDIFFPLKVLRYQKVKLALTPEEAQLCEWFGAKPMLTLAE